MNHTERLKALSSWEDLQQFLGDLDAAGLGLYGKRGYAAVDFGVVRRSPDRVSYLFDDGKSKGESFVRNLHRSLVVR